MSGLDTSATPDCGGELRPQVTVEPCMRFGLPHVRGVSVDAIGARVWAGDSVEATAEDFNLRREDVIVACWYVARHGTPADRRRWKAWLTAVETGLWRGRFDVPDPPAKEE